MSIASLTDTFAHMAFFIGAWAFAYFIAARLVSRRGATTIAVGFGPPSLDIHLSGTRYVIKLVPLLYCTIESSFLAGARRGRLAAFHAIVGAGLMAIGVVLLASAFVAPIFVAAPTNRQESRVVTKVQPGSAAELAGIRPSWQFDRMEGQPVLSDLDVIDAIQSARSTVTVSFTTPSQERRDLILPLANVQKTSEQRLGLEYETRPARGSKRPHLGDARRAMRDVAGHAASCFRYDCTPRLVASSLAHSLETFLSIAIPMLAMGMSVILVGIVFPRRFNLVAVIIGYLFALYLVRSSILGSAVGPLAALYGSPFTVLL